MKFDDFEVLTFDCYGTLIDWESRIWEALRPVLAHYHMDMPTNRVLELYAELGSDADHGYSRKAGEV